MVRTPPVQFVTTSDGVRIACVDSGGDGPPLVWTPGWVNHLELDSSLEDVAPFYQRLAANHRLVRFDGRGTGLSDRDVGDISLAARVRDIEAVVEASGLGAFDLFAWSFWGPVGIVYAAEHPDRVNRLALYATFARFISERRELAEAVLALIRAEWTIGSRTIAEFVYPNVDHDLEQVFADYFRRSASAGVAAAILEESFFSLDVTEHLARLTMPTVVLSRTDDVAVSPEAGRQLARGIAGARFVPLPGNVHVPWHGDSDAFIHALEGFLGVTPAAAPAQAAEAAVTTPIAGALSTLLFTDIADSTTLTQRLGDSAAQELIRAHDTIVRSALGAHGGTEVKHTGDGIMASFPSASRALECAVAIQRQIETSRAESGGTLDALRVRIGLNAGEPVAEGDDLFGTAVQLARRICDTAAGGEILVSDVVRQLAAGKGFLFADRGEAALRGFEDPVRLYQVAWNSPN